MSKTRTKTILNHASTPCPPIQRSLFGSVPAARSHHEDTPVLTSLYLRERSHKPRRQPRTPTPSELLYLRTELAKECPSSTPSTRGYETSGHVPLPTLGLYLTAALTHRS